MIMKKINITRLCLKYILHQNNTSYIDIIRMKSISYMRLERDSFLYTRLLYINVKGRDSPKTVECGGWIVVLEPFS